MSLARDCAACMSGDHDEHDPSHGIREGLIGGTYCACQGDCAARAAVEGDRIAALFDRRPVTGDERLAKVAEVQEQHAYCRSRTDGDTTTWECGTVTSGGFPHFPAMQRVHVTQALGPLLDEFRGEDEARALRVAADAWQRGQWTAITAKVKERNVLGTAQIVGDWIRARAALGGERGAGR